MKLLNGTLRPGKVLEVLEGGKIKASAPGLFSAEDETEKLPPIYPFFTSHANAFSCPKVGEIVWILNFTDNILQLHWFRKDNLQNDSEFPIDDEGENVEVVVNRNYGSEDEPQWATIYFSNGSGWVIRKGEDGIINIREDGSILLKYNKDKRVIDICDDSISIGAEGGADNHAMLYEEWDKWKKDDLCGMLDKFSDILKNNPYTAPAGVGLKALNMKLKSTGSNIKSNHVTLTSN